MGQQKKVKEIANLGENLRRKKKKLQCSGSREWGAQGCQRGNTRRERTGTKRRRSAGGPKRGKTQAPFSPSNIVRKEKKVKLGGGKRGLSSGKKS